MIRWNLVAALLSILASLCLVLPAEGKGVQENLAAGKSYVFSVAPNYPLCTDDGDATDLTDGVYVKTPSGSSLWGQKGCVGWQHTRGPVAITVDLGQVQSIGGVSLHAAANASGVSFPSSILLQVSEDGQHFFTVDDLIRLAEGTPPPPYNVYAECSFKTTQLATRGRYVRFNVVPSSIFFFVDEIEVYSADDSLQTQPMKLKPASDAEVIDPLRLTQLGVYQRIRTDLYRVKSIVEQSVSGPAREVLLNELAVLVKQLKTDVTPKALAGFRAILPVSQLHAKVLALHGRALAEAKFEPLTLWHTPPYQMLDLFQTPAGPMPPLSVRMMLNEHRAEVFNLTNTSPEAKKVRVRFEGLPQDVTRVYQVETVDTRELTPVASALVELHPSDGVYETIVPAGMTRQVWMSFNPRTEAHAGMHAGRIIIVESDNFKQTIDLKLSVAPISMPEQMSCSMGMWDYLTDLNYDITPENVDSARADMQAHFARTVWCGPGSVPMPKPSDIDAQGNLKGTIDYTHWDKFVKFWPGAKQYMAFAGINPRSNLAGLAQGTPAFDQLVRQWAADWARHNRETLGLAAGQVMILTMDEPGGPEDFLTTYHFAKPFREGTRDILLFVDPVGTGVHEVENAKKALELADVISPTLGHYNSGSPELRVFYQQLRTEGRQLWFYMCSGPTRHFDPGYYRLQPWHALAAGGNGSEFWAYGDAGGAGGWNEYLAVGRQSFTPVYIAPDSITTSKHWEAAREGVQDFEYAVILKRKLDKLDPSSADNAAQLLSELSGDGFAKKVAEYDQTHPGVFNNASSIGNELRLRILDLLSTER